ncbi:RE1 [Symbiodinium sp. CCMP2592]|nr:RE1 [Symbiodinium sp. CCMP2592]
MDFQYDLDAEENRLDIDEVGDRHASEGVAASRRELPRPAVPPPVSKRVRTKGPGHVESANMLKRCITTRSLEKQYSVRERASIGESFQRVNIKPSVQLKIISFKSTLITRFAYRDKAWSRRRIDKNVPWKHKARLVTGGHRDPDVESLQTDAPTINRLTVLTLLQLVSSRRASASWQASAGDITAAFLNGDPLERDLWLSQPRTGLKDLHPEQLLKITKGVFGLPDSPPRKCWRRLRDDLLGLCIEIQGKQYRFLQNPLDPCLFQLVFADSDSVSYPIGYIGVHVDDLLVNADPETIDNFEYLGSRVSVSDEGVFLSQQAHAEGRLFEIPVDRTQKDEDDATEEQRVAELFLGWHRNPKPTFNLECLSRNSCTSNLRQATFASPTSWRDALGITKTKGCG